MSVPTTDPMVTRAAGAIGGPLGRRAAVFASSWWTPVRVLLAATAVVLLLGFAEKSPCASGNWTGDKQYTHMCYSDVVPLWTDERLDVGAVPYRDTAVEYPVLTGAFMQVTAEFTRGLHALDAGWSELVMFGVLTAALLAICGLVVTALTALTGRRRPYDAALFALSPLLIFHAYTNWDLLAMALAAAALYSWARGRPVAAGVFIGLGTAAKLYPALLLLPLLVLAIRTRRWRPAVWAGVAAAVSWAAVNGPIALAYSRGWEEFYAFSESRPAERSSLWAMIRTLFTSGSNPADAVYWQPPGIAVALALVAALLLIVWLGLNAPVTPRIAQLAFLAVLAFLLTNKVWSPQYSLWLVPLLALARPRWRLALVWQFTEVAVWFVTLTLLLGLDPDRSAHGIGYGWLALLIVIRDGLLLAIAGLVVRDMWRPAGDAVRELDGSDPHGGAFRGAYDWFSRSSAVSAPDSADERDPELAPA